MAWIDDNFDESCYEWARERAEPTLLVPTEPHLGLEEAQTEALDRWARGLAREAGEGPTAIGELSRLRRVEGFWPIFFLLVVLEDPGSRVDLAGLVGEQVNARAGERGGGLRRAASGAAARSRSARAGRAAGPHGGGAAAPTSAVSAGRADAGRQARCAACFRSRRISRR